MGGSSGRMGVFAEMVAKAIGHHKTELKELDLSRTDRFSFYKIGPVISVSVSSTDNYRVKTCASDLFLSLLTIYFYATLNQK